MIIRLLSIFLIGLNTLLFADNSLGSASVEDAIQKRIEMFKSSGANIKRLSKLIRAGDTNTSSEFIDFHVKWSEEMLLLFPIGSEASTSNGSDASSDIWHDPVGFEKQVRQYNLSSVRLKEALESEDGTIINETFERLVLACKSCHKRFRN